MADERTISRDEVAAIIRRLGMLNVDDAFITRAAVLNAVTVTQMARLPSYLRKEVEPAHVFAPPLL